MKKMKSIDSAICGPNIAGSCREGEDIKPETGACVEPVEPTCGFILSTSAAGRRPPKMSKRWERTQGPEEEGMKKSGYKFVVTRNRLVPVYTKTLMDGVDALRRNARHAPAALWRL